MSKRPWWEAGSISGVPNDDTPQPKDVDMNASQALGALTKIVTAQRQTIGDLGSRIALQEEQITSLALRVTDLESRPAAVAAEPEIAADVAAAIEAAAAAVAGT